MSGKLPKRKLKSYIFLPLFIILLIVSFALYRKGLFFDLTYKLAFSPVNPTKFRQNSQSVALDEKYCDRSLWDHVYSPSRLFIIQPCVEINGVIERIDQMADGDNHIYFKPDQSYPKLINIFNQIFAGSNIIGEVVCLKTDKIEKEAKEVCEGYVNKIEVPKVGSHVKMYGFYVLDKGVGWMEIHPVSGMVNLD